ncbi:hypothetical protein SSX86_029538 [Deinandra increscens subsp. villosa]|uniref:Pectinesterase n=1 Tax=Deinandra increscens subsp. villosa TaxID=3103831 RepID=A0AAP0CCR1_9ASTR
MAKTYLLLFYCITIFIFLAFRICSEVSFCDQPPFATLCGSIIGRESESRDFGIKVSQAREALKRFLDMPHVMFDYQIDAALKDCLELYEDVINHLNLSISDIKPIDVGIWVSETVINHQICLNGFKYPEWSNLFEDVLVGHKASASNLPMTYDHGLIQLAEEGGTTQANLVVAQDGSGDFGTITEALEASANQRTGTDRFVIYVKAGIYKENIIINGSMTNLTLIGDGIDLTVITNDKNIYEGLLTSNTATVQVWGQGFIAVGITFENTAGPEKEQAIALLSASDLSVFYKCSFRGYQDTLCLLEQRQFYRECDIYGTVDFIFGDASAVLQNCNIYVRTPLPGQQNTITAQGRDNSDSYTGFVIHNSRVCPDPDSTLADGMVVTYLGRPWRDYSRVLYVKCDLDIEIDPAGWLAFRGNSIYDNVYYAEYMNTGKGANTSGRITWPGYHVLTTDDEAEQFSVRVFLSGDSWIPETGLPFDYDI